MLALLQFNLPVLLTALLIGIATGGWIARSGGRRSEPSRPSEDSTR